MKPPIIALPAPPSANRARPRSRRWNNFRLPLIGLGLWLGVEGLRAQGPAPGGPSSRPGIEARRTELLRQFDADGDGWLNEAERTRMRHEWWSQQLSNSGRRRGMFPMPPEIIKEYDKDGDGQLSDAEESAAREGIRRNWEDAQKKYDTDHDGRLDEAETAVLQADGQAGKIKGVPRFFFMRRGPGRPQAGEPGQKPGPAEIARKHDKDGDGRLSSEELSLARQELGKIRSSAPSNPVAKPANP